MLPSSGETTEWQVFPPSLGYNLIVKTLNLGTVVLREQCTQCTLSSLEATGNLSSEESRKSLRIKYHKTKWLFIYL